MLRPSDGIAVRNIGANSAASILPPDDGAHPFKVSAVLEGSGEGAKWWLGIEPGFARYSSSSFMGIADGNGNVTVGSLSVTAEDLASASLYDTKIEKVSCYKQKRYDTENKLGKNMYLADGETLVFAYSTNPGGTGVKLAVTSLAVFNSHFSNGLGGYSCTPVIGILPTGGVTQWRRICLNIMPIALFDGSGKVIQYCRDTLDMVVESETAYTTTTPLSGESETDFINRIGGNKHWGAYFYETGADGAPAGYTFETD